MYSMINVTKAYLPPLAEYVSYLEGIWQRGQLTNAGPLVTELELRLKDYLGVRHLFLLNNGTIALQLAIHALELTGDIITTPFSYVATTSSIMWEKCTPVFVDIDADTLCIDPSLIEAAITPGTQAILATHVYGNACDVQAIEIIATKYNLKVIYDAAHAFGAELASKSLLAYGDISTVSFHATKIFHTIEGGAVITDNDAVAHKLSYMRNFGHDGPEAFWGVGINGKNSEVHAAMGLCMLPRLAELITRRRELTELYNTLLAGVDCQQPTLQNNLVYNYAYYPIIMPSEGSLLMVQQSLNKEYIFPRRYFYPSLNKLNYVNSVPMPISEDIACRVLCLPLYPDLRFEEVQRIVKIIKIAF